MKFFLVLTVLCLATSGAFACSALSCSDLKNLANTYFASNYRNDMICIAYYESSWCPSAENPSGASGLWQIMPNIWLGQSGCPAKGDQNALFNADDNAKCANTVLKQQGLSAWTTWNNGDCKGWNKCTV
eukprot:CAMPEP_0184657134 /NCGR_PEP_ID=MMETSP0308-20130426/17006_1 /TAXON_ID=38269 /ORGANISM="Gloeochaete witrockiana, Strain SAG 46.84" /LENGTH=128 /DNA_ID=CAMNT_0027094563 /DNA_START=41 /DNA_END=427 /DNA_ORIENTATION=-